MTNNKNYAIDKLTGQEKKQIASIFSKLKLTPDVFTGKIEINFSNGTVCDIKVTQVYR